MKLFGSLVGLAAVLSVVPYKTETKECDGKKTFSLTSLTWKADYISESSTEEATLNIDLLGGLSDTVKDIKKRFTKEANEEFAEAADSEDHADSRE